MLTPTSKIAVIGGSLVGPTAELVFRRNGFTNVTTYEAAKQPHPQSGGVMGLRDQSLRILEEAGVPAAGTVALESADTVSFDMIGDQPQLRGRSTMPGIVTSWDKLHHALTNRVDVQLGHRLASLDHDGRAQLTFTNGETAEADLVVFADGRKSTGRTLLAPHRQLAYAGYTMWRGLVTLPKNLAVEGFSRFYDTPRSVLFSITEPIVDDGRSYWELSTNLSEEAFTRVAGGKLPTDRAFLLPGQITPLVRATVNALAKAYLPPQFRDVIFATDEIMGIPINDLPVPDQAAWKLGDAHAVLVGDALQTVRLQTGWGLNGGIGQVNCLAERLAGGVDVDQATADWQTGSIAAITPWVELGRRRAASTNLGTYRPVRPGYTAIPSEDSAWATPRWVVA
jgi:2-polyprenyl-6-methoxyphenol hydroxylase-like FAD-dependent oxidoreductase